MRRRRFIRMAADLAGLSAVSAALPGIVRAVVDAGTTAGGGALERLSPQRRCIAPDFLGLGYTEVAEGRDVSPTARVGMLAALMDALSIDRADLVANDSGGAIAQLFLARHPQRVRSLLLTNCDSEIDCPPPARDWDFPAPFGRQEVVGLPLSEIITMSRHLRAPEIHAYMNLQPLEDLRDPDTPPPTPADASGRSSQRFLHDDGSRFRRPGVRCARLPGIAGGRRPRRGARLTPP